MTNYSILLYRFAPLSCSSAMKRVTRSASKAASVEQMMNGDDGRKHHQNGHRVVHKMKPVEDQGVLFSMFSRTLMPIILMAFSPNLVILLWYTAVKCEGSFLLLFHKLTEGGVINGITRIWYDIHIGSAIAGYVIIGYCLFALVLMKTLPGPRTEGPITPKGNVPVYTDNGFYCFVVTVISFGVLTYYLKQHGMSPSIVYDKFDEFLGSLTVFSHILCICLTFKGLLAPSTTDSGSTGNIVMDYYWGTELYPRVFGIDIKVFTNCRFGMTVWPLLCLVFAVKSYELHGFVDSMWVSCVLQMIYFTKFFWWESGYMRTIDIMLDRAGFYICWGCLAYVPGLYASVSMYMVNHPIQLGPFWSILILVVGTSSIAINYIADKQKQDVRNSNGQCKIWGKPAEYIRARYNLENGDTRESLLLVSGWWGIARHFHYVPELLLSFCWSVTGLFENVMVYTYFIWLCLLLTHRTFRDDTKCRNKYGSYWADYVKRVPYKMIPGVF